MVVMCRFYTFLCKGDMVAIRRACDNSLCRYTVKVGFYRCYLDWVGVCISSDTY